MKMVLAERSGPLGEGIIRNWAMNNRSRIVLSGGLVYNRFKDRVGLQGGFGTLIDGSHGRAQDYQAKITALAAHRTQRRLESGALAYYFKNGEEHPDLKGLTKDQLKTLLGGKGFGLYLMKKLGIPVPETFTLPAWMCSKLDNGKLTKEQKAAIVENLNLMEKRTGRKFGDASNPLFVSCRSGAKVSMPGMMETVLNIGMTRTLVDQLVEKHPEKARFYLDSYCTFMQQFGNVVLEISAERARQNGGEAIDLFEQAKAELKKEKGYREDMELTPADLRKLVETYDAVYQTAKKTLPIDYKEQCFRAAETVFASWDIPRAKFARKEMGVPDHIGTAVNFVEMVFGNKGPRSATGVLFTRDNTTGENKMAGSILFNAQGEQVVAGVRDALPLEALCEGGQWGRIIYGQIVTIAKKLERVERDMQDIEFTIEQDEKGEPKLFILQTRSGKRSGEAAIKIAMDLYYEGRISAEEAIMRVEPDKFREVLFPTFDPAALKAAKDAGCCLGKGTPGTLGAGTGEIIFDPEELARLVKEQAGKPEGEKRHFILVRPMTMQDDVAGMKASDAVLTQTGSKVCHAVIMTTMWGVPCVVSFKAMEFVKNSVTGKITGITIGGQEYKAGMKFSVNGTTGEVFLGRIATLKPDDLSQAAKALLRLAEQYKRLEVRANTELDTAALAQRFGAKGSGLVRTEHMFLNPERLHNVRLMFLKYLEYINNTGTDASSITEILTNLEKSQEEDFYEIYKIFDGQGVTSRLLDAPLHEFLPEKEEDLVRLQTNLGIDRAALGQRLAKFHEVNPMLGFRSARMGIVFPEIYKSQVKAMLRAAGRLIDEGRNPKVEIEIPLVSEINEIKIIKKLVEAAAQEVANERRGKVVPYRLGIMVETPSAALSGKAVAKILGPNGFASFGTNDLTQMTKGLSRDDAEFFLSLYAELNTYNYGRKHPFLSLDPIVVRLMQTFIDDVRSIEPGFEVGICGEHGGDPYSIEVAHQIGLNSISMSAYAVPPSILAAARAKIAQRRAQVKMPLVQILMNRKI